jgi:hypothetical protein
MGYRRRAARGSVGTELSNIAFNCCSVAWLRNAGIKLRQHRVGKIADAPMVAHGKRAGGFHAG